MMLKHPYMNGTGTDMSAGGAAPVAAPNPAGGIPANPVANSAPASGQPSSDTSSQPTASTWPDKWRETYAGTDEKKLSRLTKYASPSAALDALLAAQNRISESGLKIPFPEKGSAEDQAAWRRDSGLPEAPDKYDLTGLPVTEDNKARVDEYLKFAHSQNMNPNQVKGYLKWAHEAQTKEIEAQNEAERTLVAGAQENLRAEWGMDYKSNMNRVHGLLDTAPADVKQGILGGRLADGSPIFGNPAALKFLASLALEINPATTLVPNNGGDIAGALNDELTKLQTMMGNRSSEYWKGPNADRNQERYRKLVEAQGKLAGKSKAA